MLGDMPLHTFMAECWQKRPVLLRGVFPGDFCPIGQEDLMAAAMLDDADSRLIVADEWPPELYYGPFEQDDFADLPEGDWTLLVQEMDRLRPEVAEVLNHFRFLPNWRVDDLMVSWAAPGGGVGAHTDQYDVFLIQGLGSRRWEIDPRPIDDPVWRDDSEVAVLKDFEAVESWVLEPGDVLYLPPRVAHNGVALTGCMTLSVGFRAPAPLELIESALEALREAGRGLTRHVEESGSTDDPGRISEDTLASLRGQMRAVFADDAMLNRLIAQSLSQPVRGRSGGVDESGGSRLVPCSASQLLYYRQEDQVVLCAGGESWTLPVVCLGAIAALTGTEGLEAESVAHAELRRLLDELEGSGLIRRV